MKIITKYISHLFLFALVIASGIFYIKTTNIGISRSIESSLLHIGNFQLYGDFIHYISMIMFYIGIFFSIYIGALIYKSILESYGEIVSSNTQTLLPSFIFFISQGIGITFIYTLRIQQELSFLILVFIFSVLLIHFFIKKNLNLENIPLGFSLNFSSLIFSVFIIISFIMLFLGYFIESQFFAVD